MAKNDINEKYIKCYRWFWTVLRFFSFANNNVLKEMHNRRAGEQLEQAGAGGNLPGHSDNEGTTC